ncbi:MAG: type II toxin-antitoxin system RelE/ParE family toxin [Chitinispirillales bacterium]|jgi:mRNA interferase RelE/StbE|nr:type II toxin-antitoxin system RelE/ParE family toxin [Chitinispirillales bacterium]
MPSVYTVTIKGSALKALHKLPKLAAMQISGCINGLSANPRPVGCKKLKGPNNLYRVRSGDFRIVYEIHDGRLIVLVVKVGHRKDVYQ